MGSRKRREEEERRGSEHNTKVDQSTNPRNHNIKGKDRIRREPRERLHGSIQPTKRREEREAMNRLGERPEQRKRKNEDSKYLREGVHLGDLGLQGLIHQSVALEERLPLKEL